MYNRAKNEKVIKEQASFRQHKWRLLQKQRGKEKKNRKGFCWILTRRQRLIGVSPKKGKSNYVIKIVEITTLVPIDQKEKEVKKNATRKITVWISSPKGVYQYLQEAQIRSGANGSCRKRQPNQKLPKKEIWCWSYRSLRAKLLKSSPATWRSP